MEGKCQLTEVVLWSPYEHCGMLLPQQIKDMQFKFFKKYLSIHYRVVNPTHPPAGTVYGSLWPGYGNQCMLRQEGSGMGELLFWFFWLVANFGVREVCGLDLLGVPEAWTLRSVTLFLELSPVSALHLAAWFSPQSQLFAQVKANPGLLWHERQEQTSQGTGVHS